MPVGVERRTRSPTETPWSVAQSLATSISPRPAMGLRPATCLELVVSGCA